MLKSLKINWLYLTGIILSALYAFAVIWLKGYTYEIAVAVILFAAALIMTLTDYAPALKLLFLSIPVSLEMALGEGDNKIIFPSEVLIIALAICYGMRLLFVKGFDRSFLRHPATILVILYFGWMLLTALTAQHSIVSFKYLAVNTAYGLIFYFLLYDFLNREVENIISVYYLYAVPMMFVVGYALVNHSTVAFGAFASAIVVRPYFPDHALYSAALAMLLPGFVAFVFRRKVFNLSKTTQIISAAMLALIVVGIFFSYSRATWLGVLAAGALYALMSFKVRPKYIAWGLILATTIILLSWDTLMHQLRENRYESTGIHTDLEEQTKSIGNISSDASNAERLNRWSCAIRMGLDKPITGFGPGTYQFEYFAYQRPEEMTRISVSSPYNNVVGRGGSAHSEYLLALSESGFPGLFLFAGLVIYAIYLGLRVHFNAKDEKIKLLAAIACTGLVTYAVHGLVNNFLNNNKAASLFWFMICVLVWVDTRNRRESVETVKY